MADSSPKNSAAVERFEKFLVAGGELLRRDAVEDAIGQLSAALELFPEDERALGLLGLSHFRLSAFAEAHDAYAKLCSINPNDASYRLNLGLVHLKMGKAEAAIGELRKSRELDPSQPRTVSYLGLAYARSGDYASAYEAFLRAGQSALATEMEQYLELEERQSILARVSGNDDGGAATAEVVADAAALATGEVGGDVPAGSAAPGAAADAAPVAAADAAPVAAADAAPVAAADAAPVALADDAPAVVVAADAAPVAAAEDAADEDPPVVASKPPLSDDEAGEEGGAPSPEGPTPTTAEEGAPLLPEDAAPMPPEAPVIAEGSVPVLAEASDPADANWADFADPGDPVFAGGSEPGLAAADEAAPAPATADEADTAAPRPVDELAEGMITRAVADAAPSAVAVDAARRTAVGHRPPQPLGEFATTSLVRPDDGDHAFEIGAGGVLVVRVRGRVLSRTEGVIVSSGELGFEPAARRVRGAQTSEFFGGGSAKLFVVTGSGYLVAGPREHQFSALRLDEDILYLREELVFAFEDQLHWESGHVPGSESSVGVVQFRGSGCVALRTRRPLLSIKLSSARVMYVDADVLAGWVGRVIPRLVKPAAGGRSSTPFVECSGEGVVLLEDQNES